MNKKKETKLYRAVYKEHQTNPLPSHSKSGRFHTEATGKHTTYLAESADTAWKEVTYRWKADPNSYCMVEVMVELTKIIDLTDPSIQKKYGVDASLLIGEDYGPCQKIAALLRAEGVEAIRTFSKAHSADGRQLVVFLDCLAKGSHVRVHRSRQLSGD